jgi:hypothetical protein
MRRKRREVVAHVHLEQVTTPQLPRIAWNDAVERVGLDRLWRAHVYERGLADQLEAKPVVMAAEDSGLTQRVPGSADGDGGA